MKTPTKLNENKVVKGLARQMPVIIIGLTILAGTVILLSSLGWLTVFEVKETYGTFEGTAHEISITEAVSVCDTLPQDVVKITGKVVNECSFGKFFTLADSQGNEIYVDLKAANIIIPERTNQEASVYGMLRRRGLRCYVEGIQVDF